jgi:hypothetical protein
MRLQIGKSCGAVGARDAVSHEGLSLIAKVAPTHRCRRISCLPGRQIGPAAALARDCLTPFSG